MTMMIDIDMNKNYDRCYDSYRQFNKTSQAQFHRLSHIDMKHVGYKVPCSSCGCRCRAVHSIVHSSCNEKDRISMNNAQATLALQALDM